MKKLAFVAALSLAPAAFAAEFKTLISVKGSAGGNLLFSCEVSATQVRIVQTGTPTERPTTFKETDYATAEDVQKDIDLAETGEIEFIENSLNTGMKFELDAYKYGEDGKAKTITITKQIPAQEAGDGKSGFAVNKSEATLRLQSLAQANCQPSQE
jgi:hypothetical protein